MIFRNPGPQTLAGRSLRAMVMRWEEEFSQLESEIKKTPKEKGDEMFIER